MNQAQSKSDGVIRSILFAGEQAIATLFEPEDRPLTGAASACMRFDVNACRSEVPLDPADKDSEYIPAALKPAAVDSYWRFE